MSVSLIFILYSYAPIRKQYLCVGGFPNIINIYLKPSCDIIIICFHLKTIFILLDCFTQLLQIQRLAKYNHSMNAGWMVGTLRSSVGHSNPTHCKWICLNLSKSEAAVSYNIFLREPLCKTSTAFNKNAFQWDAYHLLVDHIPACTVAGGVPAQGVYLPSGVPAQEGVCTCPRGRYLPRGVFLPGGYLLGVYLPRYSPLWTEWVADRCKNITLANFVCGR